MIHRNEMPSIAWVIDVWVSFDDAVCGLLRSIDKTDHHGKTETGVAESDGMMEGTGQTRKIF
jgi:hypothetical protein